MRRKEVAEALSLWGMKPKKVTRVRAVFKVRTEQGTFCLKPTHESEKHLLFFNSVLRYVQSKNFEVLAAYIPTLAEGPVGYFRGENLILVPWINGREISYRNKNEMVAAAELLGHFHQATKGYEPEPGIKLKNKLGKWPDKLARHAGDIEYYAELAKQGQSEFDQCFLQKMQWIHEHTLEAFCAMRDSTYYELVEASRETVQICHGDPSKRNFIKTRDGQMHMIDFESMKSDLPVVDIWRLLRRLLSRDQWNLELIKEILAGYNRGRTMSKEDYELLGIFLRFPEKVWRTLREYYEKRGRVGWSEEKLLKKLNELLAQSEDMDRFLEAYQAEYLT